MSDMSSATDTPTVKATSIDSSATGTNFLSILQNWSAASEEDCDRVKEQVALVIPEWKDKRVCCVPTRDPNRFVLDTWNFSDFCCVFDAQSDPSKPQFTRVESRLRTLIPAAYQPMTCWTGVDLMRRKIEIEVCRYTGVYVLRLIRFSSGGGQSEGSLIIANESDATCLVTHITTSFPTLAVTPKTKCSPYDWDDLTWITREEKWSVGDWPKMETDTGPQPREIVRGDVMGLVMPSRSLEPTPLEGLILEVKEWYAECMFECDICAPSKDPEATVGGLADFKHCIDCIQFDPKKRQVQSFNICNACFAKNGKLLCKKKHKSGIRAGNDPEVLAHYQEAFEKLSKE